MTKRISLTLTDEEYSLLVQAAEYYEQPIASLAGDMLVQHLHDWDSCMECEAELRARILMTCAPAGNA